jgi:hypothetical protein
MGFSWFDKLSRRNILRGHECIILFKKANEIKGRKIKDKRYSVVFQTWGRYERGGDFGRRMGTGDGHGGGGELGLYIIPQSLEHYLLLII